MSHHNFDTPEAMREQSQRLQEALGILGKEMPNLGATGLYPDGHYSSNDEGEIQFGIAADPANGKVLIDFGKPVRSLGMTPTQAIELADTLTRKAWQARGIES